MVLIILILLLFSVHSTALEINFDELCKLEIEDAAIPLENDVSLSFSPTQNPFTIEVIHASVTDALDESLFNLAEFLDTDFTELVHATPGKQIVTCTV